MKTFTMILPLEGTTDINPSDSSGVTVGEIEGATVGAIAGAKAAVTAGALIK